MRKIYFLAIALFAGFAADAQIDLKTTLVKPTAGTNVEATVAFPFELTVTVMSGSVAPTDTVWYGFTDGSSIYGRTNLTKAVGDTISFKSSLTYGTGVVPKSNYKWCSWAFVRNASGPVADPSHLNDTSCTTINIKNSVGIGTGPSTATAANGGTTLLLVPNPASNVVSFSFFSNNNQAINARVVDITGRTVVSHSYNKTAEGDYKLDISALRSGIYFVEVSQGETRLLGKLTKQ